MKKPWEAGKTARTTEHTKRDMGAEAKRGGEWLRENLEDKRRPIDYGKSGKDK